MNYHKGFFVTFVFVMTYLFLNSIGTTEIVVILMVVLMIFGAGSIPKIARTFGRTIRQVRDATQDIQRDIQESARESTKEITSVENDIKKSIED